MKKLIIGAAGFAAALAALRRFGPALHQRALRKCQQMMSRCGDVFNQQAGAALGGGAATRVPGQAATGAREPAQAVRAS